MATRGVPLYANREGLITRNCCHPCFVQVGVSSLSGVPLQLDAWAGFRDRGLPKRQGPSLDRTAMGPEECRAVRLVAGWLLELLVLLPG